MDVTKFNEPGFYHVHEVHEDGSFRYGLTKDKSGRPHAVALTEEEFHTSALALTKGAEAVLIIR